jgi:hypothetical protein
VNVDSRSYLQTYPSTGDVTTPPSLWLSSLSRTGLDGGSLHLPPTSFAGWHSPIVSKPRPT